MLQLYYKNKKKIAGALVAHWQHMQMMHSEYGMSQSSLNLGNDFAFP